MLKQKQPSMKSALLVILLVISVFSLAYYTGSPAGLILEHQSLEKAAGNMVKVTGIAVKVKNG